jgi:hypothetical protein
LCKVIKNNLKLDRLSPCDRLKYYYIDTKEKDWNRSKVLNFGIRKSKGRYIVPWDGCMLCNSSFIGKLLDYIQNINFNRHTVSVAVYESHGSNKIPKGRGYGNLWIFKAKQIKHINGYQEDITNGLEDRDVIKRLQKTFKLGKTLHSMYVDPKLYVMHLSHEKYHSKSSKKISKISHNSRNWGKQKVITKKYNLGKRKLQDDHLKISEITKTVPDKKDIPIKVPVPDKKVDLDQEIFPVNRKDIDEKTAPVEKGVPDKNEDQLEKEIPDKNAS